jgi:mannosyltransferase
LTSDRDEAREGAPGRWSAGAVASVVAGVTMVLAAALVSNRSLTLALVSDASHDLRWGPSLFRVLLGIHGLALAGAGILARRRAAPSDLGGPVDPGVSRGTWVAVASLCVVALLMRLYKLDSDLWHDEIAALIEYARPPVGEILTSFRNQNQHMLFSLLAHASFAIFGESGWAFRLPSALFGAASVWALFVMGRTVVGRTEALLASTLMTVSYHHVWFSQNGRGYIGLLFFTIVATWLWWEALWRGLRPLWLSYAVVVALGAWVHMTMVFVAVSHALVHVVGLVLAIRARLPRAASHELSAGAVPFLAWALSATLTIQLHALALPEFLASGLHEVSVPSEWTQSMWVLAESLRSLRIGFASLAVVALGGALALLGWLDILRRNARVGVAMVLPGVLSGGLMLGLGHNLWPRFFFFLMGFGLLIAIHGAMLGARLAVSRLPLGDKRIRAAEAAGVAVALAMIVVSAATVPRNYSLPKQSFTAARDFVESQRGPGDEVVAVGLAEVDFGWYYAPQWSVARTREELLAIGSASGQVWLVYTLPVQLSSVRPDIWQEVQTNFATVKIFHGTLGGGEVYVCKRKA